MSNTEVLTAPQLIKLEEKLSELASRRDEFSTNRELLHTFLLLDHYYYTEKAKWVAQNEAEYEEFKKSINFTL